MKSGLKIRWTEEAANNPDNIISYLEAGWTDKELKKFFLKFEKQLLLISIFPESYPISSEKKTIHRCVMTKNLSIYYTVKDEYLVLLSIFDTRQNPLKLKI